MAGGGSAVRDMTEDGSITFVLIAGLRGSARKGSGHEMRVGQAVKLRYNDKVRGTVKRLLINGGFSVKFDAAYDDKNRKVSGGTYEYSRNHADNFIFV